MSILKDTYASGIVRIKNTKNKKLKFKEIIYIGILLKSNKSTIEIDDWTDEINLHRPIESKLEHFFISKREWLTEAKVFVIPTLTFGQTNIEFILNEHALFGTGFTLELFHRTGITKNTFKTSESITTSLGGSIKIDIQWDRDTLPNVKFENND